MSYRTVRSIYTYTSASLFLQDSYKQIKTERPQYSIRAWSKNLKSVSASSLARILSSRRNVTKEMVPVVCEYLGLDKKETAYFEFLAFAENHLNEESFSILREVLQKYLPSDEIEN